MVLTKRFKNLDMINFAIEFYMAPDNSLINGEGGGILFLQYFCSTFLYIHGKMQKWPHSHSPCINASFVVLTDWMGPSKLVCWWYWEVMPLESN